MDAKQQVKQLIDLASNAQKIFETFSQEEVDRAVRSVGKAIYDHGEELARMAVDETGMGVYEDKIKKNKIKAKAVWYRLKSMKSRGILRELPELGLVEVAKPIGVVGAVTPITNPIITPMHNAMVALKGGNALVICPHPRAKKCAARAAELMREALRQAGAPADLIQTVAEPTVEVSSLVMRMADACVSTGGPGMVKEAYSSGKPAFGVGAGNVQGFIDRDTDLAAAVEKIVFGRTYDSGILCTCEQSLFCPREKLEEVLSLLEKEKAFVIRQADTARKLRDAVFPGGTLAKGAVGAPPRRMGQMAGIEIPEDARLIAVLPSREDGTEVFAKEKLCALLAVYPYDTWEQAVAQARENLELEGKGHSCVIHSNNRRNIEYAALQLPVCRFVVGQIGSNSLGGSFTNGLNPTATLGCGSWGNNSISENLWVHHLINISRISYPIADAVVPSDEEVWGEDA